MNDLSAYRALIAAKAAVAKPSGLDIDPDWVHPLLKPHQGDCVLWGALGGRRAWFASFGLGKSMIELETGRLMLRKLGGGRALIFCPLGVRQEFMRDAAMIGIEPEYIQREADARHDGIYLSNYEWVREGKLDPRGFDVISLDEAACLRGLGSSQTFRQLMALYEGSAAYRFVATATPSPNKYDELLAYAAFLDIMDVAQARTRFFKRDSEHADNLTLLPHMEREFWLWLASWAMFLSSPADLGHSDEGYSLPPLTKLWHEIPAGGTTEKDADRDGQGHLFRDAATGVQQASREKRDSIAGRVEEVRQIMAGLRDRDGKLADQAVIWCDLNDEQAAIERMLRAEGITVSSLTGSQPIDEREALIEQWRNRETDVFLSKPSMYGAGVNLQQSHTMIFAGIGYQFHSTIQGVHRIHRFLQQHPCTVHLIHTDAEREVKATLERKWRQHDQLTARMGQIIRDYGLAHEAIASVLTRSGKVDRQEASGASWRLVNNDSVEESFAMPDNSAGMILTSIPFGTQYQYCASMHDFGHSPDYPAFWRQMDYLTPQLLRVLQPGRECVVHVKDRVVPGGISGLGFQTIYPFHADAISHYIRHGFAFMGQITLVTDVVRENGQTYRLGWTEMAKDGSKMGAGLPEYVLIFRKPPSDTARSYADIPVVKSKADYSRSRWQTDAHGFWRADGNRLLTSEELGGLAHDEIFQRFRDGQRESVYDFERHVEIGESLEASRRLPTKFMLLQTPSWHPDVWTDVARMRTLNMLQERKGKEQHLCLAVGSLVLTKDGYKPIEQVAVGEHVLTHRGRWRPVLVSQSTGIRPVVEVKAQGVPGLVLTPDHKLWTRKSTWVRKRDGAQRTDPAWIAASETVDGYVNFKLPPAEVPSVSDELHWWLVGRWLADGHIEKRGAALISCGAHELDDLKAALGKQAGGEYRTATGYQVRIRDPQGDLRRTLKQCGHGAGGKHLPPEAFTLPADLARALLDGYLSGDGHLARWRRRWQATSVSRELLLGVAVLAQRAHGSIASIYPGRPEGSTVIDGRTVRTRQEWILSFNVPAVGARKHQFVLDDGAWKGVRSAEPAGEVETWNLRVEEDESYTAEGCIVKNCPMPFDLAERMITRYSMPGETVLDPFAGIGTVPWTAVKLGRVGAGIELNPGYWSDAVSYCRAAERELSVPTLFDLLEQEAS